MKHKGAADVDAVIDIAKDAGFAITAEEIQSMQSATMELSDEELEGVAGGLNAACVGVTLNLNHLAPTSAPFCVR